MAQGKGYQGPRRRGHQTSVLGGGTTGGGYRGPSWDQYAKKKKEPSDGPAKEVQPAGDARRPSGTGGSHEAADEERKKKMMQMATSALGKYMGGG